MFLSIVIPSYNVEAYVKDCLNSCFNQHFDCDNYEIIVVNDGSTDSTLQVVNDFISANKVSNLRVVSQENKGLSATRNVGLSIAQGDYVWFVDSDDWIAENSLERIFNLVSQYPQTEIVILNSILRKDGVDTIIDRHLTSVVGDGKYIYDNSYIYPYSGAPFYVYKRSFLTEKGLSFKEGIYFEDCLFTPLVLSRSKSCVYNEVPAYIYRLRGNSITTSSISEKKLADSIVVAEELISSINCDDVLFKDVIRDAACRTYEVLFRYYILKSDREIQKKYLRILNSNNNWKSILKGVRLKHKIYYLIMRAYALFRG